MFFKLGFFILLALFALCLFNIPEKWLEAERVKVFKAPTGTPYLADMYFDDFVNVNKKYGIKIVTLKVERVDHIISYSETWFYYKEEKLKATNEN